MPSPLMIPAAAARRFMREAQLLNRAAPDVGAAIAHLGYVQIDPINVCGRMHDLILRHRVRHYREGDLMRHLHPAAPAGCMRTAFEHHLPSTNILVAFALDAWPHLLGAMQARTRLASRWSGRLTPREKPLAERIEREIAARGPLSSDDIADGRSARAVWGSATLVKATMQKMYFHGRLLIAGRPGHRRVYDLPERVLPNGVLGSAAPAAAETIRWLVTMALRQRRLTSLKRAEAAAAEDLIAAVGISDADGPPLYCLRSDVPLLDAVAGHAPRDAEEFKPLLLAPLDPLIYDRKVTRRVWDFAYAWEAYVPPAKRVRGHYAMPLLCGHELVGHVDPKADRTAGRLRVVSRRVRRGYAAAPAVKELASFLGLR